LEWWLSIQDNYNWFVQLELDGQKVPILDKEPEIFHDLLPYWEAFRALISCRNTGFGIGHIFYSEIVAYLNENEILRYERATYIKWIQFIDSVFVELVNKKEKPKVKLKDKPKT